MPAKLLKISYPVPSNKNGQAFADTEALFTVLNGESSGLYLVGSQGMWHGGIHITDTTVPWCALSANTSAEVQYRSEGYKGEQFIRCMADGEIVAYRVCKDYEITAIEWRDEKLSTSNSFVLVKHYIQPGAEPDSGLTFYTLYMNLAPFSAYATQGNERVRKAKGQRYYLTPEDVTSSTEGGTLAAGTLVTLGDKTMTRASDKHQFSLVTLADGKEVWTASDMGYLTPVRASSAAPIPPWWSACSPAYSTLPASLTVMKTTDTLRSYLSPEDVLAGTESVSLPTGTVVMVEQQNALHQMIKGSGADARKFSLVTLTTEVSKPKRLCGDRVWVLSDNNNLVAAGGAASGTLKFDEVVPNASIRINAGDNIGHMGFFQLPEENGKRSRYQVHIECLSMGDVEKFLTNPGNVDIGDKAAFLKYSEGAPLFIKNAQGQIAASTLKTQNQGIATRSKVAMLGADGQPVAAGTEPTYYQINQEHGWLAAANVQKVSQYALGDLGFVTLDKAPESFDLIDGVKHPNNVVKGILEQMYKAAQDETRTSHALNQYNYKRLLEQIDSNHDGYYSEEEYLQAVHNISYRDHLYRIIAKHASEWYYGKDDPLWKTYLDTLTTDAPQWKTYTEAFIEKMAWMKKVSGMGPEPWHMHPVVFLDSLIDDDGMAIKWLKVEKGQVTFDAEGNDITGNRYFSRRIHWPGNDLSGVTLGRGYDMGGRSKSSIYDDMIASGIESGKADVISTAAGLKGSAAMEFVLANRDTIGDITRMQQNKLFDLIYPAYVTRTQGNYATKTAGVTEALPWDSLEQKIQDILVDFIYQGFSGERPMRAGMKNSRQELISYIENNTTISSYENGRHRANYLRGQ